MRATAVKLTSLTTLAVLLALSARAETDMTFAHFRDQAADVQGGLAEFLDRYVGACDGFFEGQGCRDKAAKFRDELRGKMLRTTIREGETGMLEKVAFDPNSHAYTLRVTPVFPGAGHLLSMGRPKRMAEDGTPLFQVLDIPARAAPGMSAQQVERLFRDGVLRVQLVFTPGDVWVVEHAGKKTYGVEMTLHALLITIGRTGEKVAAWYEPRAKRGDRPNYPPRN